MLALSGGAVFGAYQAGALAALRQSGWEPDASVGVSIGAVNGWLLARGATPEELRDLWVDLPDRLDPPSRLLAFPWNRQAPLFRAWLDAVFDRYRDRETAFPMDAVLLDALRWRPVRVPGNAASKEHLLAACALPGVMAPVRVDGRLFVDYGIARNVPLQQALELSPDELVVVDLLAAHPFPPARRLRRAAFRAKGWITGRPSDPPIGPEVQVRTVSHPRALGGPIESFRWTREFAERLFESGRHDALAALTREAERAA